MGNTEAPAGGSSTNLGRTADLYYRKLHDRNELHAAVRDFYDREAQKTTDFHRDLARLPFKLCVSASPDNLMFNAFAETSEKTPQQGYYSFQPVATPRLVTPTEKKPIVYHLFGHFAEPKSMVLTEGDLIEFLVAIVRERPPLPDQVRHIIRDKSKPFLFIGFGFHHWYLRELLRVLEIYGHQSKGIAFEDSQFFNHPEREQVVGFFSGERLIDFRELQWDTFARNLREAYETDVRRKPAFSMPTLPKLPEKAPQAFISYASENRDRVDRLVATLITRGIRVWQDTQDLRAGDEWNDRLMRVIRKVVDYVIVLQTEEMLARREGVFHGEIKAAQARQNNMPKGSKFLIPVKCGECGILSEVEDRHVINVDAPGGEDKLADSILEDWELRPPKDGQ